MYIYPVHLQARPCQHHIGPPMEPTLLLVSSDALRPNERKAKICISKSMGT